MRQITKPLKRRESKAFALRHRALQEDFGEEMVLDEDNLENLDFYWNAASKQLASADVNNNENVERNEEFGEIKNENFIWESGREIKKENSVNKTNAEIQTDYPIFDKNRETVKNNIYEFENTEVNPDNPVFIDNKNASKEFINDYKFEDNLKLSNSCKLSDKREIIKKDINEQLNQEYMHGDNTASKTFTRKSFDEEIPNAEVTGISESINVNNELINSQENANDFYYSDNDFVDDNECLETSNPNQDKKEDFNEQVKRKKTIKFNFDTMKVVDETFTQEQYSTDAPIANTQKYLQDEYSEQDKENYEHIQISDDTNLVESEETNKEESGSINNEEGLSYENDSQNDENSSDDKNIQQSNDESFIINYKKVPKLYNKNEEIKLQQENSFKNNIKVASQTKNSIFGNKIRKITLVQITDDFSFVEDIQNVDSTKSQINFLLGNDDMETGVLMLNNNSFVEPTVADRTFSLIVLKGTISVTLDDNEIVLKKHGMTVVKKGKKYRIQESNGKNSFIFLSYSIK